MGAINRMIDVLFPKRCVFCRSFLKSGEREVCNRCGKELPYVTEPPIRGTVFRECFAPLYYEGHVKDAIKRFKFRNVTAYAKPFGCILAGNIRANLDKQYDIITWVPVSARREKERGYDQSMLLALATALELSDIAVETVLVKHLEVPAQSGITVGDQRRLNVQNAFSVRDSELIVGKRVLLIDDIVTTGATLAECSRVLKEAGAAEIVCVALARSTGCGHMYV